MDKMIILILGLMVLLVGCVEQQQEIIVEENSYSSEDFVNILEQKNPELCLDFNDEDVNGSFAKNYLYNINTEETFLFKDVCLIYTISLVEHIDSETVIKPNVNDEYIVLCNQASERNYTFLEEGSYEVPAWKFCFRKAFSEYRSYAQPPTLGEIKDKETCLKLRSFQDNCLWLVAKNGDISACDLINSERNKENCKKEFS